MDLTEQKLFAHDYPKASSYRVENLEKLTSRQTHWSQGGDDRRPSVSSEAGTVFWALEPVRGASAVGVRVSGGLRPELRKGHRSSLPLGRWGRRKSRSVAGLPTYPALKPCRGKM